MKILQYENDHIYFKPFVLHPSLFGHTDTQKYNALIRQADSLYQVKDFEKSAFAFSDEFKAPDSRITMSQLYNAACSWA
jgi:hypothetical protein